MEHRREVRGVQGHPDVWQLQEAKAKFSQLIETVQVRGSQTITKNGKEVAVILSKQEFDRTVRPKDSLIEFFRRAPYPEVDLDLARSRDLPREVDL